jgi:hypothetical protein
MEKYKHKKELIKRDNLNDSADDFIQGTQDKIRTNKSNISDQSEYLKKQFLRRKKNLSSYIPKKKEDSEDQFSKLGSFKTDIGEVSVGYKKFDPDTSFRFTLISEKERDFDDKNSKLKFTDKKNYFKKSYEEDENKKYKENNSTLEFDQKSNSFRKVNIDEKVSEKSILYNDDLEKQEIKNIKKKSESFNPSSVNNAMSDLNDIKNEKKDDNLYFKNKLEKFSKMYKENKLKKFEDSDQLRVASQRLSSSNLDFILRKRMEELIESRIKLCVVIKNILSKKIGKKGVE